MNTVRTLICVTFALLIAALVYSYTDKGKEKTLEELSLEELKLEYEKAKLENKIKRERAAADSLSYQPYEPNATNSPHVAADIIPEIVAEITPQIPPATSTTNSNPSNTPPNTPPKNFVNPLAPDDLPEAELSENARLAAENAKLKKQQAQQEAENKMLHEEAGAIQKELQIRKQPEAERAAEISQALVMARVKIYDKKSGIIVLDLERAENLVTGQILGIRRGTAGGIIGRIRLGNIESSALGYADPIPQSFFGDNVDVQVGDEIIVIP